MYCSYNWAVGQFNGWWFLTERRRTCVMRVNLSNIFINGFDNCLFVDVLRSSCSNIIPFNVWMLLNGSLRLRYTQLDFCCCCFETWPCILLLTSRPKWCLDEKRVCVYAHISTGNTTNII